eukprot:43713-Eustigmatos_ZCMA.PRE.1
MDEVHALTMNTRIKYDNVWVTVHCRYSTHQQRYNADVPLRWRLCMYPEAYACIQRKGALVLPMCKLCAHHADAVLSACSE